MSVPTCCVRKKVIAHLSRLQSPSAYNEAFLLMSIYLKQDLVRSAFPAVKNPPLALLEQRSAFLLFSPLLCLSKFEEIQDLSRFLSGSGLKDITFEISGHEGRPLEGHLSQDRLVWRPAPFIPRGDFLYSSNSRVSGVLFVFGNHRRFLLSSKTLWCYPGKGSPYLGTLFLFEKGLVDCLPLTPYGLFPPAIMDDPLLTVSSVPLRTCLLARRTPPIALPSG